MTASKVLQRDGVWYRFRARTVMFHLLFRSSDYTGIGAT